MTVRCCRITILTFCLSVTWASSARAQLEFLAVEKGIVEERFRRTKFGNGKRAKELVKLSSTRQL